MKKVCIIGAGAAGLVAARHIISNPALECTIFEQGNSIGGIWVYTEKVVADEQELPIHSPMYRDLRHYCKPRIPDIVNMNKFQGKVLHSRDYRTPEIFANKRVVVLGCGPSGVDISLEIAQVATKVIMSLRNPPLAATFPDNVHQTFPIKSADAHSVFSENEEEIDCDVVIICTGFSYDFPFLSAECGVNVEKGRLVTPLFRHMIHSKFPTLCFIGIPFQVCPFILFDCQVRFFVKYLEGLIRLPSQEEMNSKIQQDKSLRKMMGLPFSRSHQLGEFQWQYFHTLAEEAEFLPKLMPVVRKIYDRVGKRRLQFPSIYRNDLVRIIDEENFQFTEFSSSNHSFSS